VVNLTATRVIVAEDIVAKPDDTDLAKQRKARADAIGSRIRWQARSSRALKAAAARWQSRFM
jgi:hypothetical protein